MNKVLSPLYVSARPRWLLVQVVVVQIVVLTLWLPALASAEIYRWVDEQGRVHYGDAPKDKAKAEQITVKVVTYTHVKVEPLAAGQSRSSATKPGEVVLYSTAWCGYCKKAKRYFADQGIAYTEYDIERDGAAHAEFKRLGGRGVPLILVGNKKMSGFSAEGFESLYR